MKAHRALFWVLCFPVIFFAVVFFPRVETADSDNLQRPIRDKGPEKFFTLRISLPSGTWFRATQREGGAVTVKDAKCIYRLTMDGSFQGGQRVRVEITNKDGAGAGGPAMAEFGIKATPTHLMSYPTTVAQIPFTVSVEQAGALDAGSMVSTRAGIKSDAVAFRLSGMCCVTCGGLETCGCAVGADCGSCCDGSCC
jgi:hypothetical protein